MNDYQTLEAALDILKCMHLYTDVKNTSVAIKVLEELIIEEKKSLGIEA